MVVIPRDMAHHKSYRFFDVDPCHIFHFGTTREVLSPVQSVPSSTATPPPGDADSLPQASKQSGDSSASTDSRVTALHFSAVCLPKLFAMFPTEQNAFLSNGDTAPGKLMHFSLVFGSETTHVTPRLLDDASCEFPSTHPQRHGVTSKYTWMMANARGKNLPFRDIVKVDELAALRALDARERGEAPSALERVQTPDIEMMSDSLLERPINGVAAAPSVATLNSAPSAPVPPITMSAITSNRIPPSVTATHKVYFSHGVVGEPIFLPRPRTRVSALDVSSSEGTSTPVTLEDGAPLDGAEDAEDDGWLFVQVYIPERHTTDFVLLDARNPHLPPVAIIHLKHHVTYGFHGQSHAA
jgi:hypothetical protein